MKLNLFILVISLLLLIYVSCKIEEKTITYFLSVLLIFLILKKYLEEQNQEDFESKEEKEAISQLDEAVQKTAESDELKARIGNLEVNIEDLKNIIRAQNIKRQMDRGEEAQTFSLTESQKRQDSNLESLEKEVDILLKLYRAENESNDKEKYKTLPVYSSCKVKDQGKQYVRGEDNRTTQEILRDIENSEALKNLGLNSESAEDLFKMMQQDDGQDIDVNFNLI